MDNLKKDIDINEDKTTIGKVIKLHYHGLIKDEDIMSLFIGLVKLVKRNANHEFERKYRNELIALRKEINLLRLENKLLKEDRR